MGSKEKGTEATLKRFTAKMQNLLGRDLSGVILFGSAASEDYLPGKSDLNLLVAISEEGMSRIESLQKEAGDWRKHRILPLFLTQEYIRNSLDSFPVEFLNMKSEYRLLLGEDALKSIKINKKDLRLQCERELKGKLLHLRQGFVLSGGKSRALRFLLIQSVAAMIPIFRALLFIQGIEIPKTKNELLLAACREFSLDEKLFCVLMALKRDKAKLNRTQLEEKVVSTIRQIEKLSQSVDRLTAA